MGWVQKTEAGTWRAGYRDPSGTCKYRTFKRKIEAERYLSTVESDKMRGNYIVPSLARMQVREWADQWWPTTLHLRPSSRARSEGILKGRILPRFGRQRIGTIRPTDVRSFVSELSAEGLSPGSVRKVYNVLRSMFGAADESGVIGRSPCMGVDLPPLSKKEMRFLTALELERLAGEMGLRYGPLVLTAGYTGLRWGELAGLKRNRVNILKCRIDVVETVVEIGGHRVTGPPKTGDRSVTLTKRLAEVLDEHMKEYRDGQGYVFGAVNGGALRRSNFMRNRFRPATERAGVAPLRFHDLRHTAAALAIAAGAHPMEIKTRLGHASIQTTLNVYGHLFRSLDERLAEALDATHREAEGQSETPGEPLSRRPFTGADRPLRSPS